MWLLCYSGDVFGLQFFFFKVNLVISESDISLLDGRGIVLGFSCFHIRDICIVIQFEWLHIWNCSGENVMVNVTFW